MLGQPNLTSNAANYNGESASSLNIPRSLFVVGTKLFVADSGNARVLVWNTVPAMPNLTPADLVLGQDSMTATTLTPYGRPGKYLREPRGVTSDGNRVVVADANGNRVLKAN